MGKKKRALLDAAIDETDNSRLLPDNDSSEDELENPDRTAVRVFRQVGRVRDLAENPSRFRAAIQNNPYANLDQREDSEYQALGEATFRSARSAAVRLGTGQFIGLLAPGVSQIPNAINTAHTANQARQLYQIAAEFQDHNEADTALKKTIQNCGDNASVKSGGQGTAAVLGVSAAVASALVVATAGIAVPVAAITAVGAAAGTGGAFGAKKTIKKIFSSSRTFNKEQSAKTLIDNAIRVDDVPAKTAARGALKALGLDLSKLNEIEPTPDDAPPTNPRRALNEIVKDLF